MKILFQTPLFFAFFYASTIFGMQDLVSRDAAKLLYRSAGTFLYTKDEKTGTVQVLLGKELRYANPSSKELISYVFNFTGHKENNDVDARATALRETQEEMAGVVTKVDLENLCTAPSLISSQGGHITYFVETHTIDLDRIRVAAQIIRARRDQEALAPGESKRPSGIEKVEWFYCDFLALQADACEFVRGETKDGGKTGFKNMLFPRFAHMVATLPEEVLELFKNSAEKSASITQK
jgi:hypothetical protein